MGTVESIMMADDDDFVNAETQAESAAADTQSIVGERIGPLRILNAIASGGIATVYKAQHTELEVVRALKVLKPGYTLETKQRFQTEAKVAANLHHPNIVQIHNVFAWEKRGLPCIEMEYVKGRSLHELIRERTAIPVTVALAMGAIVCRALDFACRQTFTVYGKQYHGLVHRDIKPANILVSDDGVVKLTDFGIALPGRVSIHTSVPGVMGTFPYASPEQINCLPLDHRSDIYSLGTVLYELIAGKRAFPQKTMPELIQSKLHGSYIFLDREKPDLPKPVVACINKSLAFDREKRFSTLESFSVALEALIAEQTTEPAAAIIQGFISGQGRHLRSAAPAASRRTSRQYFFIVAVPALVAFAAVVGVWKWTDRPAAITTTPPTPVNVSPPATRNNLQTPASAPVAAAPVVPVAAVPETVKTERSHRSEPTVEKSGRTTPYPEHEAVVPSPKVSGKAEQDTGRIKRFETAIVGGDYAAARKLSTEPPVNDGYWQVLLGRYYLLNDRLAEAEQALLKAQTVPSASESRTSAEAAWYWAVCRQAIFGTKPNLDNRHIALKAWQNFHRVWCAAGTTMRERCSEAAKRVRELGE